MWGMATIRGAQGLPAGPVAFHKILLMTWVSSVSTSTVPKGQCKRHQW